MKIFVTADLHLNHKNIIGYCDRPFTTLEQMNNTPIHNWNERVKEEDTIYIVGDFCFKNTLGGKIGEGGIEPAKYWIKQLNGNKVFIKGNHDKNNGLNTIITGLEVFFCNKNIWMVHNPLHYNPKYKINIVGHIHQHWKFKYEPNKYPFHTDGTVLVNVGVDVWDFRPVVLNKVIELAEKFKKENDYV